MFVYRGRSPDNCVTIYIDDSAVLVPAAMSVAGALLVSGQPVVRRTPVTGSGRSAWCLMGSCFDCLVDIDDVKGCQACATPVQEGMRISRPGPERCTTDNVDPWEAGP